MSQFCGNESPVRLSRPVRPRRSNSIHGGSGDVRMMALLDPDSDTFMRVAQVAYRDHLANLVPCSNCGRKFFPDRIERHEGTCAAEPLKNSKDKCKKTDKKGLRKVTSMTGVRAPPASSSQITTKPTSILQKPNTNKIVKKVTIGRVEEIYRSDESDDGYY